LDGWCGVFKQFEPPSINQETLKKIIIIVLKTKREIQQNQGGISAC
jgi:hypothetical protein